MSFDRQLVDEVNELRKDPKKYAQKLSKYLSYFDGKLLNLPGRKAGIQTHEGPKAFNEAINYLSRKNPVEPLQPSKALFRISQDYLKKIQRKNADVTEEDVDALVDKYGTYYGDFIRAADYGGENVEQSIINLIVSDGDPNRVQRESLLSSSYKLIGGATGTHPLFKFCTAIFTCTEFENNKDAEDIGYLDGGAPSKPQLKAQPQSNAKYQPQNEPKKETKIENKYVRQFGKFALEKSQQIASSKNKPQNETKIETKYQPKNEPKKETKIENKYLRQFGKYALAKSQQIASSKNQPQSETKVETKTETKYNCFGSPTETKTESKYPRRYGRPSETKEETQITTKYQPKTEKNETKYTRRYGRPETKTETQTASKYDPKSGTKVETKTETKYVGRYGKPIETTETQVITTTYEPKTKMQTQSQNRTYGRNLGGNSNTSGKKVISEKTDEKISIQGGKKIREITITKIYSDGTKDVETMVSDN